MNAIFIAVFYVTAIGIISAIVISVASKIMAVKIDQRAAQIQDCLPGANCGACGYPGCSGYAAALATVKDVKCNLCTPGGAAVMAKISALLGIDAGTIERQFAVVHCRGDNSARQKKMNYYGIQSCEAAKQLFGGEGACAFGCLGYGDCQKVCPSTAICVENGLARINTLFCTGCGLCAKTCPNNLISVKAAGGLAVSVLCKNIEKGALVRKECANGCIGCGKCVRECPAGAITLEENLARIDYSKCVPYRSQAENGCARCAAVCVTRCIYSPTGQW